MHTELFQKELALIRAAQAHMDAGALAPNVHAAFSELLDGFEKQLRQSRRLLSMGDRMQAQLNALNQEIRAKEVKYRTIFSNAAEGIFRCSPEGGLAEANPAMAAIFGYDAPDEFLAQTRHVDELFDQASDRDLYRSLLKEKGGVQRFEAAMRRADGSTVWAQISTQALDDVKENKPSQVGVILDVTEHRQMLADLAHMANTDELTGLCNRRYFMELAQREIHRAKRSQRPLSLVMADVDHFKSVNDNLGHDAGDIALRALASVMRTCIRESDICARIGGEEFIVLLPETGRHYAKQAAERLRERMEGTRIEYQETTIHITLSLGLTTWQPELEETAPATATLDCLLKNGDIALYAAKTNGRNRLETYSAECKMPCRGERKKEGDA